MLKKILKFLLFPAMFAIVAGILYLLPVWLGVSLLAVAGVFVQHNNTDLANKLAAKIGL